MSELWADLHDEMREQEEREGVYYGEETLQDLREFVFSTRAGDKEVPA